MQRVVHLFVLSSENKKETITSLDCSGNIVYLGTSAGSLQKWRVDQDQGSVDCPQYTTRQLKHVQLSKRGAVRQLQLDPTWPRLFALCDEQVTLHDTDDLTIVLTLPDGTRSAGGKAPPALKNCHCIAVSPIHRLTHRVCVAARRKLLLFTYRMHDPPNLFQELVMPSPVCSLAFTGETLCCGYTKEYSLLNCYSGEATGLWPRPRANQQPSVHLLSSDQPSEHVALARDGNTSVMVPLGSNQGGLAVPGAGNLSQIHWTSEPKAIGFKHPYVVGLLEGQVEVYSLYEKQIVQRLTNIVGAYLASVRCPKPGDSICIATERDVYMLVPTPVDLQLKSLVHKLMIDDAFDLLHRNRTDDEEANHEWTQQTHIASGFSYLYQGHPDRAFEHFTATQIDVREVLVNFPWLIPADAGREGGLLEGWASLSEESDYSVSLHDRFVAMYLERHRQSAQGADETWVAAMIECPGCAHRQSERAGGYDPLQRVRCDKCGTQRYGWRAVDAAWLNSDAARTSLPPAVLFSVERTMRQTVEMLLLFLTARRETSDPQQQRCIDFARLMIQLRRNDGKEVYDLLSQPNYCHLADCAPALQQRGLHRELALLHRSKARSAADEEAARAGLALAAQALRDGDAVRTHLTPAERDSYPAYEADSEALDRDLSEAFSAVASRQLDYLGQLLGADPGLVSCRDSAGNTLLHHTVALPDPAAPAPAAEGAPAAAGGAGAAAGGAAGVFGDPCKVQLLGMLVQSGANVHAANCVGLTPLTLAQRVGHAVWGLLRAVHEVRLLSTCIVPTATEKRSVASPAPAPAASPVSRATSRR
eukprot:TRINITY_DN9921_c0_g1_i1.p1 TRINITY_DN9921_c0_g1~~TRINITY_DN9921_c0_g1_i1.p1  ORF type:complete len:817 (+),score=307.55 TRINITY_DN9921_c0_g1_i1:118-2568(+)